MKIRSVIVALAILLAIGTGVSYGGEKPYTIMIYMNGSDLESKIGAATIDLIEILESGLHSKNANVIIFTGGANYWQNDIIPAKECVLWSAENGELLEIKRLGLLNMGNPDTLADFISFSMENFPAKKYGLIMWDHGGGAIAGFGHDEKFEYYDGSLSLPDMDYAFNKAGLRGQKLEWLGFDSCLMATVEMAAIASQYAKYLIASEDLEPADGWDYKFLGFLNRKPKASGYQIGKEIVDTFMDFYGPDSDEILTLSVVDLNMIRRVMTAMGQLMEQCSDKLLADVENNFAVLAKHRRNTKTFGEGSPRDNESDMVDIGDMATQLADIFPYEAYRVHSELKDAVLYNRHNSKIPLYGLSAYYVYGGPFYESLDLYSQLDVSEAYVRYLLKFFDELKARDTESKYHTLQSNLWGQPVTLYRTAQLTDRTRYAVPAKVNGKDCDIIVCIKDGTQELNVLGYRYTDYPVKQKGCYPFEPDDEIAVK